MLLKDLRISLKLTYRELGDYTGISYSTLARFESGVRVPTDYHIKILSSFYNVTPKYLLGESKEYIKVMSDYDLNFYNIDENEYNEYKKLDHVTFTIDKRTFVSTLNNIPQQAPYVLCRIIIKESAKKLVERHENDFGKKIKNLTQEQKLELIEYIERNFE